MMIKGLLFLLFLYTVLVWITVGYLGGEVEFIIRRGLFWTGIGVAALLVWLILERAISWWQARQANRPVAAPVPASTGAALPANAHPANAHPDDVLLAEAVAAANLRLAQSDRYKGTNTTIFDLPMYLVVGAEGAGKTAAIQNSGLEAHLLAGQATAGGGGAVPTRAANIWLAKDAIYVELAGRMFAADAARFKEWLASCRPQSKQGIEKKLAESKLGRMLDGGGVAGQLRGVLLVVDVKEFTGSPDMGRLERAAGLIRERLDAIAGHFHVAAPVYVLFSRTDQVPYFKEYFAHISAVEAEQVFGLMTSEEAVAGASDQVWAEAETRRLSRFFNQLFLKLSDRRLQALTTELQPGLRPAVYEFPREFKRIRGPVVQFLVDVFRPNPLKAPPHLRGYFFSGTRMAERRSGGGIGGDTPAFQVAPQGSLDATQLFKAGATEIFQPGMVPGLGSGRSPVAGAQVQTWVFLADLFHKVLPYDRPALAAVAVSRGLKPQLKLALAVAGGLGALGLLVWTVSWWGNRTQLAETREKVELLQALPTTMNLRSLQAADALRAQLVNLKTQNTWRIHAGLYSGDDTLQAGRLAYFRRLKAMFLDGANASLVAGLMQPASANADVSLYDRLKTHVTISNKACPVDAPLVQKVLESAVAEGRPGMDPEAALLVRRQLVYYASVLKEEEGLPVALPRSDTAVSRARAELANNSGLEPQLAALLNKVSQQVPPLKVVERAPEYAKVLAGPSEFPGHFTKAGAAIMEQLINDGKWSTGGEECVTGKDGNFASGVIQSRDTTLRMRALYYLRYAQAWQAFLKAFRVLEYHGIRDAAVKLDLLGGSQSPLLSLIKMAAENTDFQVKQGEASMLDQAINKAANTFGLSQAKKNAEKAAVIANKLGPAGMTASDVARLMQPVHVTTPPGAAVLMSPANSPYVTGLRGLQAALDKMSRGSQEEMKLAIPQGQEALTAARMGLRTLADQFANAGNMGLNFDLENLLEQPIQFADKVMPSSGGKLTQGQFNGDLAKMCSAIRPVLVKYPFNSSATAEATESDIQGLFAPNTGTIWQYQQRSLGELAKKEGNVWTFAPTVDPAMKVFITQAQLLTNVFFNSGSGMMQPRLTYSLRGGSGPQVKLTIDGTTMDTSASSFQTEFRWPGSAARGASGYYYSGKEPNPFGQYDGLWGVFRFFQIADPRPYGSKDVVWSYIRGLGGATPQKMNNPVRVQFVSFPGDIDLFNPEFFARLQCPRQAVLPQ
jgi:type VI secretion system protein ImpL